MNQSNSVFNKIGIPDTHNFIYKNKQYPFKFDFFKYCSKYFSENQDNLLSRKNINLVDDEFEQKLPFSDESIQDFIRYVQCNEVQLNNDNIITLNYLSKRYQIPILIEDTDEYISKHQHELILPILINNQDDPAFDLSTYEDMISANLTQYAKDDRLLLLNFPILYQVVAKYQLKNTEGEKMIKDNGIIDFLFKCLDKHGRTASVLFSFVDFCDSRRDYLKLLLNGYSSIFDFNFTNLSIVKVIVEVLNELDVQTKQSQKETKEKVDEIEKLKEKITELQKDKDAEAQALNLKIAELKGDKDKEVQTLNQRIVELQNDKDRIVREKDAKIDELKREKVTEMQEMNQKLAELQRDKDRIVQERNQKESEIKKLKDEIVKEKEKLRICKTIYRKDFDGIFNFLMKDTNGRIEDEVNITASHVRGSDVPKNVVMFHSDNYFNSGDYENDWICFEFKKHKIIPSHYTVKSYGDDYNAKPKTWVIEGLASNGKWKTIDNEVDCPYLKGDFAYHTFPISSGQAEEFSSIRMRLTGKTWRNDHVFLLHSFELYGVLI